MRVNPESAFVYSCSPGILCDTLVRRGRKRPRCRADVRARLGAKNPKLNVTVGLLDEKPLEAGGA